MSRDLGWSNGRGRDYCSIVISQELTGSTHAFSSTPLSVAILLIKQDSLVALLEEDVMGGDDKVRASALQRVEVI
jgi:hypothetical protein